MSIPEGAVFITPMQMYEEQRAMHDEIRALRADISPALSDLKADVHDHESRMRVLEKRVWAAIGISSAAAVVIPFIEVWMGAHH